MQEFNLKIRYFERRLSKSFKKVNFFFLSNPVRFPGQNYQNQNGSRNSDRSLFRLRNKFRKNYLFIIYYLTKFDEVT